MAFTFDSSQLISAVKKPLVWVSIILALILIGCIITERLVHDSKRNKVIVSQSMLIAAYKNAPTKIDTVHDTVHYPGVTIIKPVPFKVVIHDTILIPYRESWYDSVFNQGSIRFRWQAKGDLQFLSFSDFTWPKEIITVTRQIDTCITKPVPKQPLFRIGPYVGLSLNTFSKFPGIEAGAQVVIKDQLTVSAGGLYLNGIYGNVRVGWLLK
jgi:hypothetical protein